MAKKYMKWTHDLDDVVRSLYPTTPSEEIGRIIGVPTYSVYNRAYKLGLKKDADYLYQAQLASYQRLEATGKITRFVKGNAPHNKGKRLSEATKAKIAHTFFRKGNKPPNTKHNGYERITPDGYTEVRMGDRQFVLKQRLLWEQAQGAIPKGHAIIFADGDKTNFAIENLVCVSRGDLAILNKNKKYGREIAENVLLLSKLKNYIINKK